MSRGINDVDFDARIKNRRVLGQDRDSTLAFKIQGIHDPLDDGLVGPEDAALAQHAVYESGFSMIHVRDDGDVADIPPPAYFEIVHVLIFSNELDRRSSRKRC